MNQNRNFACRIFKEQIELILQLPEEERAEVLYKAILSGFNQIDCQIDNQNESAYVSVSVSVLSNCIFNLLSKNIVWKEFSNNYGGRRKGAGAPKRNTNAKTDEEAKQKNKTSSTQIDFNRRESFMRADPKSLVDALKRDIVPSLCAYLYTGNSPTDEQLNNYVQKRASAGWEKKGGIPIRSIGSDLANWLKNDKVEPKDENKMSDKPITYEEMIAQRGEQC